MQVLSQEYSRFSDQAGLRTQVERTHIADKLVAKSPQYGILKEKKPAEKYDKDIQLPKSIGAKHKPIAVRLPDGSETTLTDGSRITHVTTIAGLGRTRKIDIVDVLVSKYPGSQPELWQKKKGLGFIDFDGESYHAELHWYEEKSVGKVEFKVKPDADGNWFYED